MYNVTEDILCSACGKTSKFTHNANDDVVYCPHCRHRIELEDVGFEQFNRKTNNKKNKG